MSDKSCGNLLLTLVIIPHILNLLRLRARHRHVAVSNTLVLPSLLSVSRNQCCNLILTPDIIPHIQKLLRQFFAGRRQVTVSSALLLHSGVIMKGK